MMLLPSSKNCSVLVHNYAQHSDGYFELRVMDMDTALESAVAEEEAVARSGDLFE